MTAHRHADIPDDLLSSNRCPVTAKVADPIKPNKQASCGRPFYMRRNIHGGAYEDTSIKHLSSIQAQMQTV